MIPQFDIVLFGASGFTGRLVAEHLNRHYAGADLKWAVAGRNPAKLKSVLSDIGADVAIIQSDSTDPQSLQKMAAQARVVCTTVGPFDRYGSHLVEACVANGTHYCDITGEVHWVAKMMDQHEAAAIKSGARIVHFSGFDSIPSDLGAFLLQEYAKQKFGNPFSKIKARYGPLKGGLSGGTVDSMWGVIDAAKKDKNLLRLLKNPYSLNPPDTDGPLVLDQMSVRRDEAAGWTAPFLMAPVNTRVVRRSAGLMPDVYGSSFEYDESLKTGSGMGGWMRAASMNAAIVALLALGSTKPTRSALQHTLLPKSSSGPSKKDRESGFFKVEFRGTGVDEQGRSSAARLVMKGDRDPGYGATSRMIAESAVALAQDADKIKVSGGFWTPATCLGTLLKERLSNHGFSFQILSDS